MSSLSFVVASTPRSGTGYMAKLFQAMSIKCGHEEVFNLEYKTAPQSFSLSPVIGDASWMAVPYLADLSDATVIFHQVRDPLATINSILYDGLVNFEYTDNPYISFARKHVPFMPGKPTREEKAMFFWCYWHKTIEAYHNSRYYRYKLETVSPSDLMDKLGLHVDNFAVNRRRDLISPKTNSRGAYPEIVTKKNASPEVLALGRKYGYDL